MVQMTSAVSVQFHQRPLLQACCIHCSLSPCLLSLSLYCYSGVTNGKNDLYKIKKANKNLSSYAFMKVYVPAKTRMLFQNHKTNL